MAAALELNAQSRRGLEVQACSREHAGRIAFSTDGPGKSIAARVALWLVAAGFAKGHAIDGWIELTDRGAELAREEGLL